jgi:hypothetical protein
MSKGSKKKRQHYVPQMILRRFSLDARRLSLFLLKTQMRRNGVSLRDQCYRDYFYGKDPLLEDAFKAQEDSLARVLGDLDPSRLGGLGEEELREVKFFVHYQRQRTLAAAEIDEEMSDTLFKRLFRDDPRLAGVNLSNWRLKPPMPQISALAAAANSMPLVLDLQVKFIANDTPMGFLIGDAPVATYNQWAEHHPKFAAYQGYKGVAVKGVQWFLPVSPLVTIAIYDPTTYAYGSPHSWVCRAGKRDVALLNALQVLHARHCLYFRPDTVGDDELRRLIAVRESHPALGVPRIREVQTTRHANGETSEILGMTTPDPRLGAKFHFVRVIDHGRYRNYDRAIVPIRSPEVFAAYRAQQDPRDRVLDLPSSN